MFLPGVKEPTHSHASPHIWAFIQTETKTQCALAVAWYLQPSSQPILIWLCLKAVIHLFVSGLRSRCWCWHIIVQPKQENTKNFRIDLWKLYCVELKFMSVSLEAPADLRYLKYSGHTVGSKVWDRFPIPLYGTQSKEPTKNLSNYNIKCYACYAKYCDSTVGFIHNMDLTIELHIINTINSI